MPHNTASDQGLHCLFQIHQKVVEWTFSNFRVSMVRNKGVSIFTVKRTYPSRLIEQEACQGFGCLLPLCNSIIEIRESSILISSIEQLGPDFFVLYFSK